MKVAAQRMSDHIAYLYTIHLTSASSGQMVELHDFWHLRNVLLGHLCHSSKVVNGLFKYPIYYVYYKLLKI